jgi:hypothetical protein
MTVCTTSPTLQSALPRVQTVLCVRQILFALRILFMILLNQTKTQVDHLHSGLPTEGIQSMFRK